MSLSYLNERTNRMIHMLLKRSSVISIKEIAEELSVSTRTVYNELTRANDWIDEKKLPQIQIIRGKVQPFTEEEKQKLKEELQTEKQPEDYVFTPGERTKMIICQIISSRVPVYVENLMHTCLVSRNTIFADLQSVISQLYTYQLKLAYEKKRGYWIEGDAIQIRAIFFLYFNMLEPLLSTGKLSFLNSDELEKYLERLECVEKELKVSYVRNDMLALAAMIPVMEQGTDTLYFSDVSIKKVEESEEYRLAKRYFPELNKRESIYLTLHFLGGRLAACSRKTDEFKIDESVMEMARNLVIEFERKACVVFEQKEDLVQNLYHHIAASIYRYRFGIQIGNPMAEDIKREYPYIFDTVRESVKCLEQQIGVQISDSEVAYLALHFGGHMDYASYDEKELRILVVCMNGTATGNMISHELKRILPQAKIVGVMAASQITNPQKICDIIVSSVQIQTAVPTIVVNPILNDFDRKNILNHPLIRSRVGFVDIDALFQLLKKYVSADRYVELRHDLATFLAKNQEEQHAVLHPDIWRLTDFLTEDRIIFLNSDGRRKKLYEKDNYEQKSDTEDRLSNWERALYTTAFPLIERGSIDENYVQAIIDRLEEAGPYMFVTKDLILAHARPENGVKHLDLAIGIVPEGITFDEEKTARIIFLLVVEDQQKHMGILRDIKKAMSKSQQIDEIIVAEEPKAVCDLIWSKIMEL